MKRQLACLLSVRYFLAQNKMVKVIQRRKFYFINVSIDLRDRIIRKKLKGMVSRYFRGLQTILMDKAFYIFVYNFKFKVYIKIIISHWNIVRLSLYCAFIYTKQCKSKSGTRKNVQGCYLINFYCKQKPRIDLFIRRMQ